MNDVVTELRQERSGWRATINDSETLYLSKLEMRELPLSEGDSLDLEQYKHDLLLRQYPEALNRAVGYLASRAQSEGEIRRKLEARHYLDDTVEMVIFKLQKERFLDDEAFAKAWVRSRTSRQLGKSRIKQELRMKGVDDADVEAAFEELDEEDAQAQAVRLAAKLLKRYEKLEAREAMRKSVMAMQRRGFSYSDASRALSAALEQAENEN